MIRLAEKEQYKKLLQQFSRVPLGPLQTDNNRTEDEWSPRESSSYQRLLLFKTGKLYLLKKPFLISYSCNLYFLLS
jgi:hypothetical protein